MQVSAKKIAQFFIQNEYYKIHIDENTLSLTSSNSEEIIPFMQWNGEVAVHRGLIWGSLQFFAHPDGAKQTSWLVQGLPWQECQSFAHHAVDTFQQWQFNQCRQLTEYLPVWQQQLETLQKQASFLSHSQLAHWKKTLQTDLAKMNMSYDEATLHLPQPMERLALWFNESERAIKERNDNWLSQESRNWQSLFEQCESSPLNQSQQHAVLLNDDHNLILAGAGSGKTSVLTARVAYLLASAQAQGEDLLLVAFGREAAAEMRQRLDQKMGESVRDVSVHTFHQLGLRIINEVESDPVRITPLALDKDAKLAWCMEWLKKHWMTATNFKRWQKHLSKWPIAYVMGDEELGSHVENPKLLAWLEKQLDQLCAMNCAKKTIQEQIIDHSDYSQLNSELALAWPCYKAWQQMLKEQHCIDFPMMISRATDYVQKGRFKTCWKFIMIDEYQDISPDRLALIQALCEQDGEGKKAASLYAVGDDWQSIYQFAGSDVDLTTGFNLRFEHASVHHLDTTYRFNDQIGAVANRFVQANPNQVSKTLQSFKQQKQKAVVILANDKIEKTLDSLQRKVKQSRKSVLLLGRNHYHKPKHLTDWQTRFTGLDIQFMTCHGSKGKEADFVFIVNVDDGQFPAKSKTYHLSDALTKSADEFPHSEERRLFYVALTRAKEKVWVCHKGVKSVFIQELLDNDYPVINQS